MSDSANKPDASDASKAKTPAETDLSGRQLGDFRLLRRLGRGAMAEVYLAEQCGLRRRVAMKVLKPELANDRVYLKRFEIEAQAAASLVHANIVQIHEVGHVGDLHFIAQEYVQGQNLHDWLQRHGPPDLAHALSIIRQVAAALSKAAEHGVVHRDIKPENIMLTQSGEVKVADFGLARLAGEGENLGLTQVGITLGTPLYMSPEQVEGKSLDPRSDIYSFGVTCYHMLAGTPPFRGETALGVAVQHLKTQPERLEQLRPDLPAALCRMVHRMLAKAPDDRYASAREVLLELRRLYREHCADAWPDDLPDWQMSPDETLAEPRSRVTQDLDRLMKTARQERPSRRARLLRWSAVGACFLLGAAAAWLVVVPRWLLADAMAPPPTFPRRDNALQQYLDASRINTEEAWQSVIDYFPDKPYFAQRAEQQLARIYLREGKADEAMRIFTKLADPNEPDKGLRAFGLAGQCGVLTFLKRDDSKDNYRASADKVNELLPIRSYLRDPQMIRMLDSAIEKNSSELGPLTDQEWEEWLSEKLGDEG